MERVSLPKNNSKAYNQLIEMNTIVDEKAIIAGLDNGFIHLLKLRISQINGCAFCIRLHTQDAIKYGVATDKISVVAAWEDTDYFTPEEKSAFALAEAITLIHCGHVTDKVYTAASEHWDNEQLAAIEWLSIVMATFNRVAIASRYDVRPDFK